MFLQVAVTEEGLAISLYYPQERTVSLQVHNSSGKLLADVYDCLLSKEMMRKLHVKDIVLMVELKKL